MAGPARGGNGSAGYARVGRGSAGYAGGGRVPSDPAVAGSTTAARPGYYGGGPIYDSCAGYDSGYGYSGCPGYGVPIIGAVINGVFGGYGSRLLTTSGELEHGGRLPGWKRGRICLCAD